MKKPTFTIITTTYNKIDHITETIASVLQQDYPLIYRECSKKMA